MVKKVRYTVYTNVKPTANIQVPSKRVTLRPNREPLISKDLGSDRGGRESNPSSVTTKKRMPYVQTVGQALYLANTVVDMPPFTLWRYLPSGAIEIAKNEAKKMVYQCDSFHEFHIKSGLPYVEAHEMWETAWENYEKEEARATHN